jgi:NAD(P)-dependent dehydrogenase (short-subunit alcohol dehydrogenase family)
LVRRVGSESGVLHLLVNNVWGGYERLNAGAWDEWTAPFWEQPLELWDAMFDSGVRAHFVMSVLCAPLLRAAAGGMIVTVSMELGARHEAQHGVAYSVAKAADDRLALAMSSTLSAAGVASLALHPGLVRTEGVMQFADHLDLSRSQSTEGVGRVVAALAADDQGMSLTGKSLTVAELAERYRIDVRS